MVISSFNNCFSLIPLKGYCPSEEVGIYEAYGVLKWPRTSIGKRSTIACPVNKGSFASRKCLSKNRGAWDPSNVEQCKYRNKRSKILLELAQVIKNNMGLNLQCYCKK